MPGDGNVQKSNPNSSNISGWENNLDDDDNEALLQLNDELNLTISKLRSDEKYVGFDNSAAKYWIFPSNFPERAYQYNIVQKALFHNTLVVLPTGLGKTFIAAVVMYNIYRWYPMGKVIFMAPTRPLVTQQIEACVKIMGIPKEDSAEITGKLNKASRAQLWKSKRVFFATPQSVQSDIVDAELNFPFSDVKLIVVDEAHRAKGRYAYTEVVRHIWSKNKYLRILALSATPGRRKEDVEEVIRNLFISNLEVRAEDSFDVASYVHKRQLKIVVVNLGTKLTQIRDELIEIADPHIRNLIENRLICGRPSSISRNWLVMEHKKFREMTLNSTVPNQKELTSDFNICISVYHAVELLERHGLRVFLNNFDETQEAGPKFVVILRPDLRQLIQRVRDEAGPNPFAFSDQCMLNGDIAAIPKDIDFGHPKFEIARQHVLAHFESNKDSRVIVFCEYRESVMLMHRLLLQHRPVIRPRVFVGQGGSGSIRAVTQNQQINVMNDFKSGKSNALIATSVAEEGIDVGEVDLIVCFDINTSNPTRFIQRIGRTGRKKEGKVILLATEGKEHSILKEVLSERNKLNKTISRAGQFNTAFYNQAPRMVPPEFNPKCLKLFIELPQSEETKSKDKLTKAAKNNKFAQIGQKKDLRHFFKQKVDLDDEDKMIFESNEVPNKSSKPDKSTANISVSPPTAKTPGINNKTMKKMAKYIRNTTNIQPIETLKAMASNKLSKNSLQFLIEFSPNVLPDIWNRMQQLWRKGIDENNIPAKSVTNEDRQIIRAYLQVVNNVGCKESVTELIESRKSLPKFQAHSALREKHNSIFADLQHGGIGVNNFEILKEKFEQIPNHFASDHSYIQSMVYEDDSEALNQTSSLFTENSRYYSNDCIMDSKYMSQWGKESINEAGNTSKVRESQIRPTSLNVSNPNDQLSITQLIEAVTKNDSDDDVVFVGTTHQSTPIRSNASKQSVLHFSETPIINSALKRSSQKRKLPMQRSQKNILDFIKVSKVPIVQTASPKIDVEKIPEQAEDNTMNFFDDQFDDIIAANSGILEHIENINQVNINSKSTSNPSSDDKEKASTSNPPQNAEKKSSLGFDDCTPDEIISLIDVQQEKHHHQTAKEPPTVKSESPKCEAVHPELADIDINNLSEFSIDSALLTQHFSQTNRASPDIFDELCESIPQPKAEVKTPVKAIKTPSSTERSPCLLTKKTLTWGQIRQKYIKPMQPESSKKTTANHVSQEAPHPDESVISVPSKIRSKRRIIESDTDSSEDNKCSPIPKGQPRISPKEQLIPKSLLRKKRNMEFIDDEAVLSGSASEDELEHTIGHYIQDSVVVHDDEVDNEYAIPMTGVYLQSVKSPCGNIRGGFKIPERRQYNDSSKIFSQRMPQDNNGSYVTDSFVVISDDESDGEKSMCPLERAEEILKNERRLKRKAKQDAIEEAFFQPAKKKRVLRIHNSSDDDDFV